MAEQTFWIIAALAIVIVVVITIIILYGGQVGPFKSWVFRITGQQELCRQLSIKGCVNAYLPQLENDQSEITYSQIGKTPGDVKARFGEVCEFFGFKNFDDCLKSCNCMTP